MFLKRSGWLSPGAQAIGKACAQVLGCVEMGIGYPLGLSHLVEVAQRHEGPRDNRDTVCSDLISGPLIATGVYL